MTPSSGVSPPQLHPPIFWPCTFAMLSVCTGHKNIKIKYLEAGHVPFLPYYSSKHCFDWGSQDMLSARWVMCNKSSPYSVGIKPLCRDYSMKDELLCSIPTLSMQ
jgi:hypothetical protein